MKSRKVLVVLSCLILSYLVSVVCGSVIGRVGKHPRHQTYEKAGNKESYLKLSYLILSYVMLSSGDIDIGSRSSIKRHDS